MFSKEVLSVSPKTLLRPEQVIYNHEWQKIIGPRRNVLYNAMGPDITTVLLLTNTDKIVGVDPNASFKHTKDYLELYWDYVDIKPILRAGAAGYSWGITPQGFQPSVYDWDLFLKHVGDRNRRGYWDVGAVNRWDIDRLLMLELKKLGLSRSSIDLKLVGKRYSLEEHLNLSFEWAYPGEKPKIRTLEYYSRTLDQLLENKRFQRSLDRVDFYYQKSLPDSRLTIKYLEGIAPYLGKNSFSAVGFLAAIDWNWPGGNESYADAIGKTFGRNSKRLFLDSVYEKMIDTIPDDQDEMNKYGMKLHVFAK